MVSQQITAQGGAQVTIDILPKDAVADLVSLGELSLDGGLVAVNGALPAALAAAEAGRSLFCPEGSGAEAAWIGSTPVIAPATLTAAIQHLTGARALDVSQPGEVAPPRLQADLAEVKGQERAKRALEIAAAGRHHGHHQHVAR